MNRPAEIAGVTGAVAFLIARSLGVSDPYTVTALGTVVGFVPAAVTWLILRLRKPQ